MKIEKTIGILLILGAVGVLVPYTVLTLTFDYPDILRQDSGAVLTRFQAGGPLLIFTWLAFALLGLPLLAAYPLIGKLLETRLPHTGWVTHTGVISVVVQVVGLLRWVFVVPVLASDFVNADNPATKEAVLVTFKAVHQFGGVLLGEHLGQLLTIIWTVYMSSALLKLRIIPRWLSVLGYVASLVYLPAQADLFATVIPRFPVIDVAGLLGSTLWLLWLILVGVRFLNAKKAVPSREVDYHLTAV